MNVYELTVIFYPDCDESIVEKILIKVEKIITSSKGKVLRKQKKLGLKRLAYPIKKQTKGIFFVMRFSCQPKDVSSITNTLQLQDKVLRFMVLKQYKVIKK